MATLKFPFFFKLKEKGCAKDNRGTFLIDHVFILFELLEYLIKELPVPTKRTTFIVIKVKSCNALLRMLLVHIP